MITIVTMSLALFPALIVAGLSLEATEGQNVTISFDIDAVEKADQVKITCKRVDGKRVVAQQPWNYTVTPPPPGVSMLVEKGRVSVTIQNVNISRSGLYEALALIKNKPFTVNVTLLVHKAHFSSTTAPPHSPTPKPPNSSDLLWLCALIPLVIVISGVVCFCKRKKASITLYFYR